MLPAMCRPEHRIGSWSACRGKRTRLSRAGLRESGEPGAVLFSFYYRNNYAQAAPLAAGERISGAEQRVVGRGRLNENRHHQAGRWCRIVGDGWDQACG
jgi:hypothetical protein